MKRIIVSVITIFTVSFLLSGCKKKEFSKKDIVGKSWTGQCFLDVTDQEGKNSKFTYKFKITFNDDDTGKVISNYIWDDGETQQEMKDDITNINYTIQGNTITGKEKDGDVFNFDFKNGSLLLKTDLLTDGFKTQGWKINKADEVINLSAK